MANKAINYFIEAKEELQKVTWPTQKETIRYTIMVSVFSIAMAIFFGLVDFGAQVGLESLINISGVQTTTQSIPTHTAPVDAGPALDLSDLNIETSGDSGSVTIEEADPEAPVGDESEN